MAFPTHSAPNSFSSLEKLAEETQSPLWRIKYRPHTLETIKRDFPKIYRQFQGYLSSSNIPHIMFVGPAGSGKTMLAELLARELLQSEYDINTKILYADDPIGKQERKDAKRQGHISSKRVGSSAGADRRFRPFIQIRVRPFVSNQKFGQSPFKILIIKNFHVLDVEQQAFRRIMEQYSSNCRMILITDRISGIIDPIISRCHIVMVPFVKAPFFNRILKKVCDQEGIVIKLDLLNYLRVMAENNIGKALDLLQLTYLRFSTITIENLSKMSREMNYKAITDLFAKTINGNFKKSIATLRQIFQTNHLSKNEVLLELNRVVLTLPLERAVRAQYLDLIAQCDFNALDSNDDEIQLRNLLAKMTLIGQYVK